MFQTIDEYIALQPEQYRPVLRRLRETIAKAAPEATEAISWHMPSFQQNGPIIYFALNKKHIGLYPTSSPIVHFARELALYKTSKGAVQIPLDEEVPWDLVSQMVRFKVRENQKKTLQSL
ncbi:MAG: DUF1801 domain-containing protein [Coriobacteriia bacterium]|nr:DUF1801 domain-containing protein [Coriobacteriia bacterium]